MASQNEQKEWKTRIIDGPSKLGLMSALFDDRPQKVKFKFFILPEKIVGTTLRARIFSVERLNPINEDWKITGCLLGTTMTFTAEYSTKTRLGVAKLVGY